MRPDAPGTAQRRRRVAGIVAAALAGLAVVASGGLLARRLRGGRSGLRGGVASPTDAEDPAIGADDPKPLASGGTISFDDAQGDAPGPGADSPPPASVRPPRQPTLYRLRLAAGAQGLGEVEAEAEGSVRLTAQPPVEVAEPRLRNWALGYQRRWSSKLLGWQPQASARLTPAGPEAALRWSRALLPLLGQEFSKEDVADGTGLDVHLETSMAGRLAEPPTPADPLEAAARAATFALDNNPSGLLEPTWRLRLRQQAEVVFGPRAQQKYLNVSFPFSGVVGVAASNEEAAEGGTSDLGYAIASGPLTVYARLDSPGLRELRGWAGAVDVADAWAGRLRAQLQRPWSWRGNSNWFVEHQRTNAPIWLGGPLARAYSAVGQAISGVFDKLGPGTALDDSSAAIIPTTGVRIGSDGKAAQLALETPGSRAGRGGWGATVAASTLGWGASLRLAGGSKDSPWGQPQYAIEAKAPWKERLVQLSHEVRWMFSDGQGAWVTVRHSDKGPRVSLGLEVR